MSTPVIGSFFRVKSSSSDEIHIQTTNSDSDADVKSRSRRTSVGRSRHVSIAAGALFTETSVDSSLLYSHQTVRSRQLAQRAEGLSADLEEDLSCQ
jgi:hypothetical protein